MRLAAPFLGALVLGGCMVDLPGMGDSLDGTRWQVVAVNGQATPAAGDYSMQFDSLQISARFGCNGMGGRYRRTGDTLVVRNLVQTLMGCGEPAATFERNGSAVLNAPMRISRHPTTGGLVLSNANGRIDLTLIVTGTRLGN